MAGKAQELANYLPNKYHFTFDQEPFTDSFQRLINHDYDILVGFQLAFTGNPKIRYFSLGKINLCLLFNSQELQTAGSPQELTQNSTLYLHQGQTTDVNPIKTGLISLYQRHEWSFKEVEGFNSFEAIALNINYNGGFAMFPEIISVPASCKNITVVHPQHLKQCLSIDAAITRDNQQLARTLSRAISKGYHQ